MLHRVHTQLKVNTPSYDAMHFWKNAVAHLTFVCQLLPNIPRGTKSNNEYINNESNNMTLVVP